MIEIVIFSLCFCAVIMAFKDAVLPIILECAYIIAMMVLAVFYPAIAYSLSFGRHLQGCFTIGTIFDHIYHVLNIMYCITSVIYGLHNMYFAQQIVVSLLQLWLRSVVGSKNVIQCMIVAYAGIYACVLLW
jgi:hypothetical protein